MTKTLIPWANRVWNPVTGCTKVSQGCKHCYAEREWESRFTFNPRHIAFGRKFSDVQVHPLRLALPLTWKKPAKIFVNSMSDLFHESVSFEFIAAVFGVMALAPQHVFQVLTKRPERMEQFFAWARHEGRRFGPADLCIMKLLSSPFGNKPDALPRHIEPIVRSQEAMSAISWPLPNVWLGVSIEDQQTADQRIPSLQRVPAAVRWVSAEPLLGPVDMSYWFDLYQYEEGDAWHPRNLSRPSISPDWIVVGGESGPNARPMHPDWARVLRDQCTAASVAFNFKQWGEFIVPEDGAEACRVCGCTWNNACDNSCYWAEPSLCSNCTGKEVPDGDRPVKYRRVGKRHTGRLLDGQLWDQYPMEVPV
ncbi:phage Gp37/Gp68 family protein [Chromobacterium haemolyticum]|uniref:phage Gp37/Gp68 family protein n=1 Tax=Chromobacterium haemolyticum TaxID=394935 RepID=UPI00244CA974|nr:phage Gp37/Gp68 family protein [Chromobacterium haemolyticum]MDH0342092.1 phage Gp37/Gp68 family protein [Chromobacterium haemolyticum]